MASYKTKKLCKKKMKIAYLLLVAILLAGCGDDPPKSIQDTSRDITKVSDAFDGGQKLLIIDIKPSSGRSDSDFFFMATEDIKKILKNIVEHFPNQAANRIDFIISTGLSDKYGNSKDFPVIGLSFDSNEVTKINFKGGNFTSWDLLRLVNSVKYLHPAGKSIVVGYCGDESNAKYANDFCGIESKRASVNNPLQAADATKVLTAAQAERIAKDTFAYFQSREAQFSENAVMNDEALSATFLFSKELKEISARWPAILDGDAEADKYGHCRHLILAAQSYAEAMNQFAFKGGTEKLAKERRKDFLKDQQGCKKELIA